MPQVIHIVNGPNLNFVGRRENSIYGQEDLNSYLEKLKQEFSQVKIETYQSNHEGELIDYIQSIYEKTSAIIINAGAYSHTSIAIRDALLIHKCPIIEVHISNLLERELFRQHSYIKDLAWSFIQGQGIAGYRIAVLRVLELAEK